mgnify:CR=1 FL=1
MKLLNLLVLLTCLLLTFSTGCRARSSKKKHTNNHRKTSPLNISKTKKRPHRKKRWTKKFRAKNTKHIRQLYKRIAQDLQKGHPLVMTIHVALCDNKYQGIVPVPGRLGNGDKPLQNLYWGAMYGFHGEFRRSKDWKRLSYRKKKGKILAQAVFSKRFRPNSFWRKLGVKRPFTAYLIGKAYRGRFIRQTVTQFTKDVYQDNTEILTLPGGKQIRAGGQSHIIGFIGHNYLMDIKAAQYPFKKLRRKQQLQKGVFILACRSFSYFSKYILNTKTHNLAMTRTLMAPESYTVRAMLNQFAKGSNLKGIWRSCVRAYAKYQRIRFRAAGTVFRSGS